MRGPRPLDSFATVLRGLARRLGLETPLLEHRLQREWPEIAGEPLASNTWPDRIRYKKLHLRVSNSVWMHQLTFLKPALIQKLATIAGPEAITDLALRVGEMPASIVSPDLSIRPQAQPTPVIAFPPEVSIPIAAIQDPAIRRRFIEVIGAYPSRVPPPTGSGPSRVP